MAPIRMLALSIRPVLTVALDRLSSSSLRIRVVAADVYAQRAGSEPQLLSKAIVDSTNTLSWTERQAGGWLLSTQLEMRVAVALPRGFSLPAVAVERPASAILRRVCAHQCGLFLASVEAAWSEWQETEAEHRST